MRGPFGWAQNRGGAPSPAALRAATYRTLGEEARRAMGGLAEGAIRRPSCVPLPNTNRPDRPR